MTEFEIFQSHEVLTGVVASLNLKERWSKKYNHGQKLSDSEIEEMIKHHLKLRNIQRTELIELKVFDDDPDEAAQLANAIAQQYCRVRTEEFRLLASKASNSTTPLKFQPPEIVDPAVPQIQPVGPNRPLASTMLGCGILLTIAGFICLKDAKS